MRALPERHVRTMVKCFEKNPQKSSFSQERSTRSSGKARIIRKQMEEEVSGTGEVLAVNGD